MALHGLDERRLSSLLEVGRGLVSDLDTEAVLRRVLEVARELTGAGYAALGILDPRGPELERFLVAGIDDEAHRAISEHVRRFGFTPADAEMDAFLGAPIMIRAEASGSIYLTDKEGKFDEHDQETLVVLAEWAAVAIDKARLYEAVEGRREKLERAVSGLEATTAIARAVGSETDLNRVLELVVRRARALVNARSALILLADGDELLVSVVAGETPAETMGSRLPTAGTAAGEVLRRGHVERLSQLQAHSRPGLGALSPDAETAMLVPLTFRGRTLGVLVTLDRVGRPSEFDDEDERLMRSFATSAAMAVATAQSVGSEQLRLSIAAAEAERKRWARELHDETLQGLGAVQLMLTSAVRVVDPDAQERATGQAIDHLGEEIERLQSLITELRPAALDEIGLGPALESLVERTRIVHGLDIETEIDLDHETGRQRTRLSDETESGIYRLVQEALTNTAKHSRAERAWIRLVESEGRVSVEVRDDGAGFDPSHADGGYGLMGMRERVALLGGSLTVDSDHGSGTTVRAELPAEHRSAQSEPGPSTG